MLKSIIKNVLVSTNIRGGDDGAELVGMTKNQKKVPKGEPHILVVEFFLFKKYMQNPGVEGRLLERI